MKWETICRDFSGETFESRGLTINGNREKELSWFIWSISAARIWCIEFIIFLGDSGFG
jgi:hypothetical protein